MKSYGTTYRAMEAGDAQHGAENDGVIVSPHLRGILLILISLITIGSHYGKHSLSSLGPEIMASLDVKRLQFGILFSSQEIPGIVLPVVGGIALTYVPHGPAAIVLSSSVLMSTALCAIAVVRKSYMSLFIGRFLFGLSDGALTTLQGALVAHWFRHRIGRSFGVTLLVSRISSFLGLSLPAFLSQNLGLGASMWISAALCIPPLIATILYTVYVGRLEYSQHSRTAYPLSSEALPRDGSSFEPHSRRLVDIMRSFPISFWTICYIWVAVAGSVFSLLHFAPDAFSSHFGISAAQSGFMTGSLVLIAGLSSPAVGVLQDRIGRRSAILGGSCAFIGIGVLLCAAGVEKESGRYTVIVGLGFIAIGLSAGPVTLLSSLALCVDDFGTAAALGLYKGTENAGLAVLHVFTGALRDGSGSYVQSFVLLAGLAASGVVAAVVLGRTAPILGVPAKDMLPDPRDRLVASGENEGV